MAEKKDKSKRKSQLDIIEEKLEQAEKRNSKNPIESIKNFIINFIPNLKNNKKFRIKVIITAVVLLLLIVGGIFLNNWLVSEELKKKNKKEVSTNDLRIIIPKGAFSKEKNFIVTPLAENTIEYQNLKSLGNFFGKIYNVMPGDNILESSFEPIFIRYKIPKQSYLGNSYNNFSIGYASEDNPPVVAELPGCKIVQDAKDGEYYVEAESFHLSKIGLIIKSTQEPQYGLKQIQEKKTTLEPELIVVPGSDINFVGYLLNTNTSENPYGNNIWSMLFPSRTIWTYNYPTTETRSLNYMIAFNGFVERTGEKSYIKFEAMRLAQELKRFPNRTFDIVAHGIGGLIARYALESEPTIKNVKNIVLVSTPNLGSNILNPMYYNSIYGKTADNLANIYSIDSRTIMAINYKIQLYLEQSNLYYKELMPNSPFLNKLNSLGLRKDMRYMTVAGKNPNIEEDITKSTLSTFYPEFKKGNGDGTLTLESAQLKEIQNNAVFNKTSDNLYTDNKVLDLIKTFLNSSVEKINLDKFKDDDFIESSSEINDATSTSNTKKATSTESTNYFADILKEKLKIPTKDSTSNTNKTITFPSTNLINTIPKTNNATPVIENIPPKTISKTPSGLFKTIVKPTKTKLIENLNSKGTIDNYSVKINVIGNDYYLETTRAFYNKTMEAKYSGTVYGGIVYNNKYYVSTENGIYSINPENNSINIISKNKPGFTEGYYLPDVGLIGIDNKPNQSYVYLNQKVISSKNIFVRPKISGNKFYMVFKDRITSLYSGKLSTIFDLNNAKSILKTSIGSIKDFEISNGIYFILTFDNKLLMYEPEKSLYQIISKDISGQKLLKFKNKIVLVEAKKLSLIDPVKRELTGLYQPFSDEIMDMAILQNNKAVIVFVNQRGKEIWTGDLVF